MKIISSLQILFLLGVFNIIQSTDYRCITRPRDIAVILESSNRIISQDFDNAKIGLMMFTSYFLISPKDTRISLTGYGQQPKVDFLFEKYGDPAKLNFAIRLHRRIGGEVIALGEALNITLFDVIPKMRPEVEKVLIVIGDGKNTGKVDSVPVASLIKAKDVKIYTIGIGSEINEPQMKLISSDNKMTTFPSEIEKSLKAIIDVVCVVEIPFDPNKVVKFSKIQTSTIQEATEIQTSTVQESTTRETTTPKPIVLQTVTAIKQETITLTEKPITKEKKPVPTSITKDATTTTTTREPTIKITQATTTSNFIQIATPEQTCETQKLDLIFVLDASSSIARYWKKELVFANHVVSSLVINKNSSQVGVVTYSDEIFLSIPLGSSLNKTDLQDQISNLDLLEGATYIAMALRRAKDELVTNGRKDANKTILLVTDGGDNSPNIKPDVEAENIKKLGIKIVVVGLGYSVIKDELNKMSSTESYYPIEDLSKLAIFDTSALAEDACQVPKPIRICNAKLDIVLIIDSSSQVPNQDWIKQLNFATSFIQQYDLGVNKTRISLISFANEANLEQEFTDIYPDLFKKLESIKYVGGFTRIDKALRLASQTFYIKSSNSRKLVVLLSNGMSQSRVESIGASYDLQETKVDLITIGLGEGADRDELRILSSSSMSYLKKDVKEVQTILESAVKQTCHLSPVEKLNICPANGDVIFIVDRSTENTDEIWEGVKSLMLTTIHSLNISKTQTRISIIDYSDDSKTEFRLDENFSKRDIYVAIKQLKREGGAGGSALSAAFRRARQVLKIDNRLEVANVVVVFSDRLPDNQKDTLNEAETLKVDGTTIIYVGLTKNSPYVYYEDVASKKNSIKIENINEIDKLKEQIRNSICDVLRHRQDECSLKKLDVVITIDKSSSLGPKNFKVELDFVNRIVSNMDLRKDRTEVGIYTFNTEVDFHIGLDSNLDNTGMQKEISKIPFIEGQTAIGLAINNASIHFAEKGRENVPKVLVVITDGSNNVGMSPQIAAVAAKQTGIKIISVGVGDLISEKELKDISTSGELYNIRTFQDLEKFNAKTISNDACLIPTKPTICKAAGDLIYILGSSADKGTERFQQMAAFMKSLTKLTVIAPEYTRVAVLKYNRGAYIDSGFKEDFTNFENSIEELTSSTNGVFIGKALKSAGALFKSDTRTNATKTVIIISDSELFDKNDTFTEAVSLKRSGIKIFTIGLSGKVNDADLKLVASPEKALFVETFGNLQRYNALISSELCEVIRGTNKECSLKQLEIMFALDSSSSIGPTFWKNELDFIDRIVRDMDIGESLTRLGIITFNTDSQKQFGLDTFSDKYAILSAVKKIEYSDGSTAIGDALRECKWELMNSTRRDVPKIIVLVTDGVSNGGISPEIESTVIKKLGIKIISIGIGNSISSNQLKTLSSSGSYYGILDFKSLDEYDTTYITRESCKAGKNS